VGVPLRDRRSRELRLDVAHERRGELVVDHAAENERQVIFGLPGPYTPTCSASHLPGYVTGLEALRAKGVDEVWCVSVNDAFVMAAWGRSLGAIGKVRMLGDGSAELTKKLGLDQDLIGGGIGVRSKRYSMFVEVDRARRVVRQRGPVARA
jgi:peroxiredoxin